MSEEDAVFKRQKLENEADDSDEISDPAGPSEQQMGAIFKLNNHCLEKIFDYLSLKDLHSMSETCTDMQQYTGDFFKFNYAANQNDCTRSGISTVYLERDSATKRKTHIKISGFNRFMRNFSCSLIGLHFHYIKWHYKEFESIQHAYMQNSYLNFHKYFKVTMGHMLKNVEVVQLRNCTIDTNLYDVILVLCKRLKRLHVQDAQLGIPKIFMEQPQGIGPPQHAAEISSVQYPWLLNAYSTLEHLELLPRYVFEIDELCDFFALNPNVRSFSTSTQCLWANQRKLLQSNLNLDVLEVKFYHMNDSHPNIESICNLVKQLYSRGFYKKLHFYFHDHKNVSDFQHVFTLDALEKLFVERFYRSYNFAHLSDLKELAIVRDFTPADMEYLAKHLKNLERLDLVRNATFEHILPFIRNSVNLRKIRLGADVGHLKLGMCNEQRTKLINARSVTIYVPDNIYLNMKWNYNYGETDFNAIKMRRTTSCDWNHHYVF